MREHCRREGYNAIAVPEVIKYDAVLLVEMQEAYTVVNVRHVKFPGLAASEWNDGDLVATRMKPFRGKCMVCLSLLV